MPDRPYCAGETAPVTGLYQVTHDAHLAAEQRHRPAHLAIIVEGDLLPPCNCCGGAVSYRLVAEGIHLLHDWDFTAPPELLTSSRRRDERRTFPRLAVDMHMWVHLRGQRKSSGRLQNLTEAGVGAAIRDDLPAADVLSVEFTLPRNGQPTTLATRLCYRSGQRYGFEFIKTTVRQRAQIRRFCQDPTRR